MQHASTDFDAEVVEMPSAVVFKLRGEIRLDTRHPELQFNRVVALQSPLVIVDLSDLSFFSSIGMGLLVGLKHDVAMYGGTVRLAAVQPLVKDALDRTGLGAYFGMFPTIEAAIAGGYSHQNDQAVAFSSDAARASSDPPPSRPTAGQ